MKLNLSSFLALFCFLTVCALAQGIGAKMALPALIEWYPGLVKPPWTPPAGVFGPVWAVLYLLLAFSGWFVWVKRSEEHYEGFPLLLFFLQLVLTVFWKVLFFGTRNPGWAFYEICLLWILTCFAGITSNHISRPAGLLMVPYFLWLTFTACLNYAIWRLN